MEQQTGHSEEQGEGNSEALDFRWDTADVMTRLHTGWQQEIIDVAKNFKTERVLEPPHSTSREGADVERLVVHCVGGKVVQRELAWLVELYRGRFREIGEEFRRERLFTAADPRYAVVLNVQVPGKRYECHVDTNPVEALLYVTDHPEGTGGELTVAKDVHARCQEEIDANCVTLHPREGELVFFDGRFHPHYVRRQTGAIRVAVAMNYYTESVPESTRPDDLNDYLYGPQA